MGAAAGLIGKRFGHLEVIEEVRHCGRLAALCRCDCGVEKAILVHNLMARTKSCGCQKGSMIADTKKLDLAGKQFGRLTAIEPCGTRRRYVVWLCKCSCGNSAKVPVRDLTAGDTVSCGCARGRVPVRSDVARARAAVNRNNRRARERLAIGSYSLADIQLLIVRQRGVCAGCPSVLGVNFHRDHIIPLLLGGSNDIYNIQLLCPPCNLSKGARHPLEWAKQHGRLF